MFIFAPNSMSAWKYHEGKGLEPYMVGWDGNSQSLYSHKDKGCRNGATYGGVFCTALVQHNNWQFPSDYPFNIRY